VKIKSDPNLYVKKDERRKLDAKSLKCVFIGYFPDKKHQRSIMKKSCCKIGYYVPESMK